MTYQPQDLNHNHNPDPNHRYGCRNSDRPRSETRPHLVQDGWYPDGTRRMASHKTEWLPMACGHTWNYSDPACEGCEWRDA